MNPERQTSAVANGVGAGAGTGAAAAASAGAMMTQNGGSPRTSQEIALGPPPPPPPVPRNGPSSAADGPNHEQDIIYVPDDYLPEPSPVPQQLQTRRRHAFPTYYSASLPLRNRRLVPKYRFRCLEVVCLLYSAGNVFRVPRGANRTHLASQHLTGKIDVAASMTPKEVRDKVASVFWRIFQLDSPDRFTFTYLSLMPNSKRLQKPSLSATFKWTGKEVIRIANRNKLYIMASREIMPQMEGWEPHSETESSLVISGSEENTASRLGALEAGDNCASLPRVCEVLPHFTARGNSHEAPFPVSLTSSDRLNLELHPELSRLCATAEIDESSSAMTSQPWKRWTLNELLALFDIWENPFIRSKLANGKDDKHVFDNMSTMLASRGFSRPAQQVREKVIGLRQTHLTLSDSKLHDALDGDRLRVYQRMEAILGPVPSKDSMSAGRHYAASASVAARDAGYPDEDVVMDHDHEHDEDDDEDNKDSLRALLNLNAAAAAGTEDDASHPQPSTSMVQQQQQQHEQQHHLFVGSGNVLDTPAHHGHASPIGPGELYRDCSADNERNFSSIEQLIDRFIDAHEQSEIRFLAAEEKRAEDERNHFDKQCRHDKELMQMLVDLEERRRVQDREHESRMWTMLTSLVPNADGNRAASATPTCAPILNVTPNWEFSGVFRQAAAAAVAVAAATSDAQASSSSRASSNEK